MSIRRRWKSVAAVAAVLAMLPLGALRAERRSSPWKGVRYEHEVRRDPALELHWVEVDLAVADETVAVSRGGADPDGEEGPYQTTLMTPSAVAAREGYDLAVNGDFFSVKAEPGAGVGYRADQWARVVGPAASGGKAWAASKAKRPCLVVMKDGRLRIGVHDVAPPDAEAVVAGNRMLVEKGKAVPSTNEAKHPRTAVGLDEKGTKLVILVVDGRRPGVSVGMSYAELSAEMIRRGCHAAINLDGGGSTALIMRDPATGELRVMNRPSDGRERAVGNVVGIRFAKGAGKGE